METNSLLKKVNWHLAASAVVLIATLAMGGSLFVSCESADSEETARLDDTMEQLIARGKYLVNTSACHDCHTPKIMTPNGLQFDTTCLLSGHPASAPKPKVNKDALKDLVLFGQDLTSAAAPWGVSFAAHLTVMKRVLGTGRRNNSLQRSGRGNSKAFKEGGVCYRLCRGWSTAA